MIVPVIIGPGISMFVDVVCELSMLIVLLLAILLTCTFVIYSVSANTIFHIFTCCLLLHTYCCGEWFDTKQGSPQLILFF